MSDLTQKRIKIDSIQEKPTTTGTKRWTVKDVAGEWYSIWDEMVAARIRAGDDIVVMVQAKPGKDGKIYHNITGLGDIDLANAEPVGMDELTPSFATALSPAPTPTPKPIAMPVPTSHDNMVDVRISALSAAMKIYSKDEITLKAIEPTADRFVNYILNKKAVEQNISSQEYVA